MKAEIKTKWLEALRSGKYKQGQIHLRTGDNFCCLGVLCELARQEKVVKTEESYQIGGDDTLLYYYGGNDSFLPEEVMDWADLDSNDPEVHSTLPNIYGFRSLSELNDSNVSFNEIADLIETQIETN